MSYRDEFPEGYKAQEWVIDERTTDRILEALNATFQSVNLPRRSHLNEWTRTRLGINMMRALRGGDVFIHYHPERGAAQQLALHRMLDPKRVSWWAFFRQTRGWSLADRLIFAGERLKRRSEG